MTKDEVMEAFKLISMGRFGSLQVERLALRLADRQPDVPVAAPEAAKDKPKTAAKK